MGDKTDRKVVLTAAKIIKDYCQKQECQRCVFGDLQFCRMKEGGCPAYWEIK
nr:MAG TPA: hypothetical protein [Caudoviricetes sp.]